MTLSSEARLVRPRLDPEREHLLIERARRAPEAFRELYDEYFPRVYAYVAYRVGSRQDAEDIVSESFLKMVEKLDTFKYRGEGSFAAWLFRIAQNLVTDRYRHRRRKAEPLTLEALPDLQDAGVLPELAAEQQEERNRLRCLIATLSPRRQEIITLKFFSGLRNREIAAVLGLDERAVASHLCRGLEDLHRKYLNDRVETRERFP